MTKNDAIRKMEFCKNAYQKLIDEEVDNGTFVGTGVNGVWKADTPLTKAYSDMVDACNMAIKALDQEPILDKIRAEIHATAEMREDGDYYLRDEWIDEIIDKYKAESEET